MHPSPNTQHSSHKGVVLPGAERWHRSSVIAYAAQYGFAPVLAVQHGEKAVVDEPMQHLVSSVITLPAAPSEKELVAMANHLNHLFERWVVLPLDDYVSESAAMLAQYTSLSCFPLASAHEVFHKHLLRERWNSFCELHSELPLAQVAYALYVAADNMVVPIAPYLSSCSRFAESEKSFIIKPNAYSGSVAVFRANSIKDVPIAVEDCANLMEKESVNPEMKGIIIDRHILVEEEIPRKQALAGCAEFTAHYLSVNGKHLLLGIAEKLIDESTFIETAHIFPTPSFPESLLPVLNVTVTALLNSLQVQNTISNWEFIVTPDDKLAMVEGQLRPSGDHVMELIENALQVSPYVLFFRAIETGALPIDDICPRHTSIICWPRPSIVMDRISHVQQPAHLPKDVHLNIDRDALLHSSNWQGPLTWYDRHISVIATAADHKQAWQKCRETLYSIHLKGICAEGKHIESTLVAPSSIKSLLGEGH